MPEVTISRLGYALGALVRGVDLARDLSDDAVAAIRSAWLEHAVLCFPGQNLTTAQLLAFASRFGTPAIEENAARHHEFATVTMVVNKRFTLGEKTFPGNIADEWHTDQAYTVRPASASFLNAKALPKVGGSTLFANMYAAYDALSPAMRLLVDGLEGIYDAARSPYFQAKPAQERAALRAARPPVRHPFVRIHPETARRSLFLDSRLSGFSGMSSEESQPLCEFLRRHATQPERVYCHRWELHDLVMWDNRCTMHYAVPDYDVAEVRWLARCELVGAQTGHRLSAGDR